MKAMTVSIRTPKLSYQDGASLARRFGVSYDAAVWRLKSLGRIGTGETNTLLAQRDMANRYMRALFDGQSETAKEPRDQELRGQLVRLALRSLNFLRIDRMDVASFADLTLTGRGW